jgi:hypothetical protein
MPNGPGTFTFGRGERKRRRRGRKGPGPFSSVTPETNREISGEQDKELFETPKIDVKSFRVLP